MTYMEKIEDAQKCGIKIIFDFPNDRNVVGIYRFFYIDNQNERYCFYIGKSTDVAYRLLGASHGHIYMYLKNNFSKLVPLKIKEYLEQGYKIEVEVKKIDYSDTSFSRAAHRLALAELEEIVHYQEKGQCLFQTPEGAGTYEEQFWEKNYKIEDCN